MEVTSSATSEVPNLTYLGLSGANMSAFAKAQGFLPPLMRLIKPRAFAAIWSARHRLAGQVHSMPWLLIGLH